MISIGQLSKRVGVKVPTIRYYEDQGLMPQAGRSSGNQRRYDAAGIERLSFIKHARDLGFSMKSIAALLELQAEADHKCVPATQSAQAQLDAVRRKITKLRSLENELLRIVQSCDGNGVSENCNVLAALADHSLCLQDH